MDKVDTLKRIEKLVEHFKNGDIPTLIEHEVNPGLDIPSRENYLYFTLPVCINFQRSSPAMWQSALKTWNDTETNYLFFPEQVVITDIEKIKQDLFKHRLSLQINKHADIWTKISSTLHKLFNNDPREIYKKGNNNVVKILNLIQNEQKEHFPYLRGQKLANYWLFIQSKYTDIKLTNMHEISIIPDTHIIQSTAALGLAQENEAPEKVAIVWKELLKDSLFTPVELHPILWNWSRNKFNPQV